MSSFSCLLLFLVSSLALVLSVLVSHLLVSAISVVLLSPSVLILISSSFDVACICLFSSSFFVVPFVLPSLSLVSSDIVHLLFLIGESIFYLCGAFFKNY
jgi:hypothetical protein